MKLPVFNSEVRQPFEEGLVRLPESAFTSVLAADPEEGSTTVEYAIGAVATAVILMRVWNMLCWRADSRSLVRVVRVPSM